MFTVRLQHEDATLQDYVIYSMINNYMKGNFTPVSNAERPCYEQESKPYFVLKHSRTERSKRLKNKNNYRYNRRGLTSKYYFRQKLTNRGERSIGIARFRGKKSLRYRRLFMPTRILSGPLKNRKTVVMKWTVSETTHIESNANVIFR